MRLLLLSFLLVFIVESSPAHALVKSISLPGSAIRVGESARRAEAPPRVAVSLAQLRHAVPEQDQPVQNSAPARALAVFDGGAAGKASAAVAVPTAFSSTSGIARSKDAAMVDKRGTISMAAALRRQIFPHQRVMRRTPAFSLIELLVVATIIAILLSLLSVGLAGVRNAMRSNKCLAHLNNLGLSTYVFYESHQGKLPIQSTNTQVPQFEIPAATWRCPSDKVNFPTNTPQLASSYAYLPYIYMLPENYNLPPGPPSQELAKRAYDRNFTNLPLYFDTYIYHPGKRYPGYPVPGFANATYLDGHARMWLP